MDGERNERIARRNGRPLFLAGGRTKSGGTAVPPLCPIHHRLASSCGSQGIAPRHSKEHRCRRISRRFCDALPTLPTRLRSGCCGQAACRNARTFHRRPGIGHGTAYWDCSGYVPVPRLWPSSDALGVEPSPSDSAKDLDRLPHQPCRTVPVDDFVACLNECFGCAPCYGEERTYVFWGTGDGVPGWTPARTLRTSVAQVSPISVISCRNRCETPDECPAPSFVWIPLFSEAP